jgi:O-antigen ligase
MFDGYHTSGLGTMSVHSLWIPLYLFICLLLGGASNAGFVANGALQLLATVMIGWAFWSPSSSPLGDKKTSLVWLLIAVALLILLQFVPLPSALWEMPIGRAEFAAEAAEIGIEYSPLLWGLSPYRAVKSATWLLPAVALGVALLRRPNWQPNNLAWATIIAMALSVSLGAVQISQGRESPAYLYEITNNGSTVGFFANSNHLATLLLVSIPLIAALLKWQLMTDKKEYDLPAILVGACLLIVCFAGIVVNKSGAGLGLVGPVTLASAMIFVERVSWRKAGLVVLSVGLAGGLTWLFLSPDAASFHELGASNSSAGSRLEIWAVTINAIRDFWPLGSGLGTFAEVYVRFEDPSEVTTEYINHAHNDYLELVLEFGIVVLPIMLLFFVWWGGRLIQIWVEETPNPFAFAGAIASGAILAHSIVDYPLRTVAISCVFAFSLCLMVLRNGQSKASEDTRR